jgi:hypothetical protein
MRLLGEIIPSPFLSLALVILKSFYFHAFSIQNSRVNGSHYR